MNKQENIKYISLPIVNKGKRMETKKETKGNFKMITIILIILMSLLLLFSGYTFAKSLEEKIINSNTQIAKPILEINSKQGITEIELENTETDYFTITNNNKEERKYKIKITYDKDKSQSISDIIQKIKLYQKCFYSKLYYFIHNHCIS